MRYRSAANHNRQRRTYAGVNVEESAPLFINRVCRQPHNCEPRPRAKLTRGMVAAVDTALAYRYIPRHREHRAARILCLLSNVVANMATRGSRWRGATAALALRYCSDMIREWLCCAKMKKAPPPRRAMASQGHASTFPSAGAPETCRFCRLNINERSTPGPRRALYMAGRGSDPSLGEATSSRPLGRRFVTDAASSPCRIRGIERPQSYNRPSASRLLALSVRWPALRGK